MNDGGFEWDERKAAGNYARHGVSFARRELLPELLAIEQLDDREDYGEDRFIIIGMVEGRLLSVAYTMRGETIRIISARGAEPYEQRRYHEDNG